MCLSKILAFSIIFSILIQPLGLVTPVLAETVEMEYSDPDHLHAPSEVNGTTYLYDANGNLLDDGERKIEWNQDNKPIRITKGDQVVEFFYDASSRRTVKRSDQRTTTYVNERYQSSVDAEGNLSATKHYFANGRVAQSVDDSLIFLYQDYLGSTILATDSNSQKLTDPLSYFPYGSLVNNLTMEQFNNYLFTGQELDENTGLYNYKARLYNPTTGVFISADSVVGGNRYAYAANNPMVFVDPSGNNIWDVVKDVWETVKTAYGSFLAEQVLYSAGEYEAYEKLSSEYREEKSAVIAGELGVLNLYYSIPAIVAWLQFGKDYVYYNHFYSAEGTVIVRPATPGELVPSYNVHPGSNGAPGGMFLGDETTRSGEIVYGDTLWERYNTPGVVKPGHVHEMTHWDQFVARGYKKAQSMPEFAWDEIEAFESEITYLQNIGIPEANPSWYASYSGVRETYISDWGERITGWYNRGRGAYGGW